MSSRSGELATRPLPAVLLDLFDDKATGKLVLKRGRVSKDVNLVGGNPVSTASNPRDETLGHFLVNSGVITEDQHRNAINRAAEHGGKLGQALMSLGIVANEAQLADLLAKQARHKIVQALRWPQGAWRFDDGPPLDGGSLNMVEVVLGGLRETAVVDLGRLARFDKLSFELTPRGKQIANELRRAFGERMIALLEARAPIGQLDRAFTERAGARLALDAMMLCDAVTTVSAGVGLGAGPAGSRPDVVKPTKPQPPQPPQPRLADPVPELQPITVGEDTSPGLFDLLFDDLGFQTEGGSLPIDLTYTEVEFDSGVVSNAEVVAASADREKQLIARKTFAVEHQRVRGADHYAVLMVGRKSSFHEIDGAHTIRMSLLERDAALMTDSRDRAKVDDIRKAYEAARSTLLDDRKRAAYDRELAGGELVQVAPAIDTELSFRVAEDLMARKQWSQAIGHLRTVIARSPAEADYHAALGWAEWMLGKQQPGAADEAFGHLNQALAINPDHPAAHDYKGQIEATLRRDDAEAMFYLERAIDLDPTRTEPVAVIEALLIGRGELRRLERVLKRLLFRLRGRGGVPEAKAWARLARLYLDHLDDPQAGTAAIANARRISPKDSDVGSLIGRADKQRPAHAEPLRAGWREALTDPASGAALVKTTAEHGHIDAAFLAASTMVAMGTADAHMASLYEQNRVRGVVLPERPLDRDQWAMLRHRDDGVELGGLMELVAPAIHALAPMTLADSDLDPNQRLDDADVPAVFSRMRARCAELLGVVAAPVFARVELGSQIHVVACDPPVLVAGDEALTAPDRPELAFRLVRAMTFLWPGRAVGASRPGRVMRAIVMAIFREASGSDVGLDDALAEPASKAIRALPPQSRAQARAAAMRVLSRGGGLNLSLWAKSLSRTADRAGMLLCGDVPAAFTGAAEVGELDPDLVEFAYSAAHVNLRAQLGLSGRR
ncbi:MAG: DUF4388 domain-containing protein [Kofleriaceae bacterium]